MLAGPLWYLWVVVTCLSVGVCARGQIHVNERGVNYLTRTRADDNGNRHTRISAFTPVNV